MRVENVLLSIRNIDSLSKIFYLIGETFPIVVKNTPFVSHWSVGMDFHIIFQTTYFLTRNYSKFKSTVQKHIGIAFLDCYIVAIVDG